MMLLFITTLLAIIQPTECERFLSRNHLREETIRLEERLHTLASKDKNLRQYDTLLFFHIYEMSIGDNQLIRKNLEDMSFLDRTFPLFYENVGSKTLIPSQWVYRNRFLRFFRKINIRIKSGERYIKTKSFITDRKGDLIAVADACTTKYPITFQDYELAKFLYDNNQPFMCSFWGERVFIGVNRFICIQDNEIFGIETTSGSLFKKEWGSFIEPTIKELVSIAPFIVHSYW